MMNQKKRKREKKMNKKERERKRKRKNRRKRTRKQKKMMNKRKGNTKKKGNKVQGKFSHPLPVAYYNNTLQQSFQLHPHTCCSRFVSAQQNLWLNQFRAHINV
jgi:hypothetical protein